MKARLKSLAIQVLVVCTLFAQVTPAVVSAAQIIPDGKTATTLITDGNITDITTGTISQNTGFNSFSQFNTDAGNIVNLHLPTNTDNLINTVNGSQSTLNGILNAVKNGDIGGNVYFLNPHGIIVGSTGQINVGSLSLITPTTSFMGGIYNSDGTPNSQSLSNILAYKIPLSETGLISVSGKINAGDNIYLAANDINIAAADSVVTTGAVFSSNGLVNTDKIKFSDVVNINGLDSGTKLVTENGSITIKATNDITVDGLIKTDGSTDYKAGEITLTAGNNLTLNQSAQILARGIGSNSGYGDITLTVSQTHKPTIISAIAQAKISILGAKLAGKDINLTATSFADYSWSFTDPQTIVVGTVAALTSIAGAGVGIVQADSVAKITIGSGSDLYADQNLKVEADSSASTGMMSFDPLLGQAVGIGVVYSNLVSDASVNIESGAKISAVDLDLQAKNTADVDVSVIAISTNNAALEAALAYSEADVKSAVNIASGATVQASGNFSASADNQNKFAVSATAMVLHDGAAGIAATIFNADTNAKTNINTNIIGAKSLTITANDAILKNKVSSSATAGSNIIFRTALGGFGITDFVMKHLASGGPSGLNEASGATEKPKLAGAVTITNQDHQATALIGKNSNINVSGDVTLYAKVSDARLQNHAGAGVESQAEGDVSNPSATYSLSAAVGYGDYNHSANAYIAENAKVSANRIGIGSLVDIPYEITWHKWEGLSTITNKLNGNLGLANGFITGWTNATGTPKEGGIAGSVSYLNFNNTSHAYIARGVDILLKSGSTDAWTSQIGKETINWAHAMAISAATNVTGVYAAGNIALTLNGAGGEPGAAVAGGGYAQVNYNNDTRSYVAEGVKINPTGTPVNIGITAASKEQAIVMGPTSGRGASYGLNGTFAMANINNTTIAEVDDAAQVSAGTLDLLASDDIVTWSVAGAFNSSESVGIGLGVAFNEVNTNTKAILGGEITADKVAINARTDGRVETIAVSGSMPSASEPQAKEPGKLDGVKAKLSGVLGKGGAKAPAGNQQPPPQPKFGIGISGSSAINLVEMQTIANVDQVKLILRARSDNQLLLRAINDTDITAASGSAALVRANNPSQKFSAGIAGSVTYNDLANTTEALVKNSTVTGAKDVSVEALSGGEQLSIAIGAAVNTSANQEKAGEAAGSVSLSFTDHTVSAQIADSTITGTNPQGDLNVIAYDRTYVGTGGGSLIAGGKGGFGAAVTYSEITNDTTSTVANSTIKDYEDINVEALCATKIASGGAMAGLTVKTNTATFGGVAVVNEIANNTVASIENNANVTATNDVNVVAKDSSGEATLDQLIDANDGGHSNAKSLDYDGTEIGATTGNGSSIIAVAGVVQGGGNNVGISLVYNKINNTFAARISETALRARAVTVASQSHAAITGISVGVGIAAGQFGGGGSITINEISNTTSSTITAGSGKQTTINADSLVVQAKDQSQIDSLAGQVAISTGNASVGGTVAYNEIGNKTQAQVTNTDLAVKNTTDITADNDSKIRTLSAAGGGSASFAFNGSGSYAEISNQTSAELITSRANTAGNFTKLTANDNAHIQSLSGSVAVSGNVAVGAAVAVNRISSSTTTRVLGSLNPGSKYLLRNLIIQSTASGLIESLAVGVGGTVTVGVAGSVAVNLIDSDTTSYISDGAKIIALDNIAVLSKSDDKISNAAGVAAIGATGGGVGASVTVNKITGDTTSYITGSDTQVTAHADNQTNTVTVVTGELTGDVDLASSLDIEKYGRTDLTALQEEKQVTGLVVNAAATHSVENIVANISGGLYAGVAGTTNTAIWSGKTKAYIEQAQINPTIVPPYLGSDQTVSVIASDHAYNNGFIGSLAVGAAGVGLSVDTNVFENETQAYIRNVGSFTAAKAVEVAAKSTQGVSSLVVGGAGGAVGVVGSGTVNTFKSTTHAEFSGSQLQKGSLLVDADHISRMFAASGGAAVGGVAVGGTFSVGTDESTTTAKIADATVNTNESVTVNAASETEFDNLGISGAGAGAGAVAGAVVVNQLNNTTTATITESQIGTASSRANQVTINASDDVTLKNMTTGAAVAQGLGVGASAAVTTVNNTVQSYLEDSNVSVKQDLDIQATATRDIQTISASLGAGGNVGLAGAVGVVVVGDDITDQDAVGELDKDGKGSYSSVNDFTNTGHVNTGDSGLTNAEQQAINTQGNVDVKLVANVPSGTEASIRGASTVDAGGKIAINANDESKISLNTGAGSFGTGAVGAAVSVANVTNNVTANVLATTAGRPELKTTQGGITISASASDLHSEDMGLDVNAYQGSGGLIAAVGAAVSTAKLTNNVSAGLDSGTSIIIAQGQPLNITAVDSTSVNAQAQGYQASGFAAVGAVVARAEKAGQTNALLGRTTGNLAVTTVTLNTGDLNVKAQRSGSVGAFTIAGSGGIVAGAGSDAKAVETGQITATIGDYVALLGMNARTNLVATATPQVYARAYGFAGSAYGSVGVSLAEAIAKNTVVARVGRNSYLAAKALSISAVTNNPSGKPTITADGIGASGGLVGVNATISKVRTENTVTAAINPDTELAIGSDLNIAANNLSNSQATVTGVSVGGIAAGANLAHTDSINKTEASVASNVTGQVGGKINVTATGSDTLAADSTSGSGGVISGAAAKATTNSHTTTEAKLGGAQLEAGSVNITAEQNTTFNGYSDSINASVAGGSGAIVDNKVDANVTAAILDGAKLTTGELDMSAKNVVDKPDDGYNAKSGSGGLLDGAAAQSKSTINTDTTTSIGKNAVIKITNTTGSSDLTATSEIDATDRAKLDSGGAIAIAKATSNITVDDKSSVEVGENTQINSAQDLNLSVMGDTGVNTSANAKTYGLASAAAGEAKATVYSQSLIDLLANAIITGSGNVNLKITPQGRNVTANTDLYNKTAIPMETKPSADAKLDQKNVVTLHSGAQLNTEGNVSINVGHGNRYVYGYGVGKDLYREALAEVGSFFSNLFGGDDVVLDIKGGSSTDQSYTGIVINGQIAVGTKNQRYLIINPDGTVNRTESSEGLSVTVTQETIANDLQTRINELNGLIQAFKTSGTASSYENPALVDEKDNLTTEKTSKTNTRTALNREKSDLEAENQQKSGAMATNNMKITGWKNDIAALDKTAPDYATKKAALEAQITTAQGENTTLQGGITKNTNRINGYIESGTYQPGINDSVATITARITVINNRIAEIDQLLVPQDTSGTSALLAQYEAEKAMLTARLEGLGTGQAKVLNMAQDVTARSSNIYFNADNLTGTGELKAPGDTLIKVVNKSPFILRTSKLTIPDEAGGRIYFNNVSVNNVSQINARNRNAVAGFSNMLTADNTTAKILVENTYLPSSGKGADLFINNDIRNFSGEVIVASPYGSVQVDEGVDIVANTIKISAGRDITIGYKDGTRNVMGTTKSLWKNVIDRAQAGFRDTNSGNKTVAELLGKTGYIAPSIIAGNNIFIAAEYLNINGVIQSGLPLRAITIPNTLQLQNQINQFQTMYDTFGGDPIFTGLYINNVGEVGSEAQLNAIPVYYNASTRSLELAPVLSGGGYMELYGNIVSTGLGELRILDGYSRIEVNNGTYYPLVIKGLNAGNGVAGTVKITDLAKRTASGEPLVTVYRRENSNVNIYDNYDSPEVDFSQVVGSSRNSRTQTYQPVEDMYYSWTTMDSATWIEKRNKYYEKWFFLFNTDEEYSYGGTTSHSYQTGIPVGADVYRKVTGHNQAYWYDITYFTNYGGWRDLTDWITEKNYVAYKKYRLEQERSARMTILHNHNISASNPIGINFIGSDQGNIKVTSFGDIQLGGQVVNDGGPIQMVTLGRITSLAGGHNQVSLQGPLIELYSQKGIGYDHQPIKTSLDGNVISAVATQQGGIYLEQTVGDLVIAKAEVKSGNVDLVAEGNILTSGIPIIKGNQIRLESQTGSIGTDTTAVQIDSEPSRTGGLVASATDSIHIREVSGDLYVDTATVNSGNVKLVVSDGDLIDNNDEQVIDTRTREQLLKLWDEMLLTDQGAKISADQTIAAYERLKAREYEDYWQYRKQQYDSAGNPISANNYDQDALIKLTQAQRNYYTTELNWNETQIQTLEAKMTADYHLYHADYGTGSYTPGWSYTVAKPTDSAGNIIYDEKLYDVAMYKEWHSLVNGTAWTRAQLENPVNVGFLMETSDTRIMIEAANASGNNVELVANQGSIGSTNQPVTIKLNGRTWNDLTDDEKLLIMTAEREDLEIISDNEIRITNVDDFNVTVTGTLSARAKDQIYLGSESDLNLNTIKAGQDLRIKTARGIYQNGSTSITATRMILEAGQNSIGTNNQRLLITLLNNGHLTARAGDSVYLSSQGDLNLDTLYAVNLVDLLTAGQINDAVNAQLNIRAGAVNLTANKGIGTKLGPVKVGVDQAGQLNATAKENIYLSSPKHSLNIGNITTDGDIVIVGSEDIKISSTTGGIKTEYGNVTIDTAKSITQSDTSNNAAITGQNIYLIVNGTGDTSGQQIFTIGSAEQALQINTLSLGRISATAQDGIYLVEMLGDLNIEEVTSSQGNVVLEAKAGNITAGNTSPSITAKQLDLIATGDIGTQNRYVTIAVDNITTTGKSIYLQQTAGDMNINATSNQGGIYLQALAGDINANQINSNEQAYLEASKSINITEALATSNVMLDAQEDVTANKITSTQGTIYFVAVNVAATELSAGKDIFAVVSGDMEIGTAHVAQQAYIDAGGNLNIDKLTTESGMIYLLVGSQHQPGTGTINANQLVAGTVVIVDAGADLTVDQVSAIGQAALTAHGDINANKITSEQGAITLHSIKKADASESGSITATQLIAGTDILVTSEAKDITVNQAIANGYVAMMASGNIVTSGVQAANGDIRMRGNDITADTLTGQNMLVIAEGEITIDQASAAEHVTMMAISDLTANTVTATTGDIDLRGNDVATQTLTAGNDIYIDASHAVTVEQATASRDLNIVADGDMDLGVITATTGSLNVAGNNVAADNLAAGTIIVARAQAGLAVTEATGGQHVAMIAAGDIDLGTATATTGFMNVAGNNVTAGTLTAGADMRVTTTADVTATDLNAGRNINVDASGAVTVEQAIAQDNIAMFAGDAIEMKNFTANTGDISLTAGSDIRNVDTAADVVNLNAKNITLLSKRGSIGAADNYLYVDASEKINASADLNVYVRQVGDFVSDLLHSTNGTLGIESEQGDILVNELKALDLLAVARTAGASIDVNHAEIAKSMTIAADNINFTQLDHVGRQLLLLDLTGGSQEMINSLTLKISDEDGGLNFSRLYADKLEIKAAADHVWFADLLVGSRADIYSNNYYVIADNINKILYDTDLQLYPQQRHFYLGMNVDRLLLTDALIVNYHPDFIANIFGTENSMIRQANKLSQVVTPQSRSTGDLFGNAARLLLDWDGLVTEAEEEEQD